MRTVETWVSHARYVRPGFTLFAGGRPLPRLPCFLESFPLIPRAVEDVENIGPPARGAVVDQVFSCRKTFHPGSDALRSLPRVGMFPEHPETVSDLVDDTVGDLQTRALCPIGENLVEIAL